MSGLSSFSVAFIASVTLLLADVSCSGSTSGSAGSGEDAGVDAQPDVVDAPEDTSADVTPLPDVSVDVGVDVVADVSFDVELDTGTDAPAEATVDAGFTPGSLNNLVVWLAADVGVTAGPSGSVSNWLDQSGQQNHASQGSAGAQPLVLSAALNGLPVIHFDGVSDHLSLPPGLADFSLGVSAFVLVRPASNTSLHAARFFDFAQSYGTLTNSLLLVRFTSAGDELLYQTYPGSTPGEYVSAPGAIVNGLWQTYEVVAAGGSPESSVSASLYKDGVNVGGGVANVPALVNRNSNFIARSNLSSNPYLKGDIAELIIYARALTNAERQQVEAYLDAKWAL